MTQLQVGPLRCAWAAGNGRMESGDSNEREGKNDPFLGTSTIVKENPDSV